jgi:hypothetical protein
MPAGSQQQQRSQPGASHARRQQAPQEWISGQWIAKQQLARQGTKCFWRLPVGQQKSAQLHEGIKYAFMRSPGWHRGLRTID